MCIIFTPAGTHFVVLAFCTAIKLSSHIIRRSVTTIKQHVRDVEIEIGFKFRGIDDATLTIIGATNGQSIQFGCFSETNRLYFAHNTRALRRNRVYAMLIYVRGSHIRFPFVRNNIKYIWLNAANRFAIPCIFGIGIIPNTFIRNSARIPKKKSFENFCDNIQMQYRLYI